MDTCDDSIVRAVVAKFLQRSAVGVTKYGVTLDRTDLGAGDWIQHAQEELMDGILYLEKLKQTLASSGSPVPPVPPSPASLSDPSK